MIAGKPCRHDKLGINMEQACIACWRDRAIFFHDQCVDLREENAELKAELEAQLRQQMGNDVVDESLAILRGEDAES